MCRNLFKFFNSLCILFRLVPFALFFSFLPYFRIPTRVIDGEDLNELLIFISGEMHHEREFLDDHTVHLSVAHGIGRRVGLQRMDLDYYLLLET